MIILLFDTKYTFIYVIELVVNLVCAGDHLLRLPPPLCPLRGGGCQTVLEGPAMVLRGYVHCIFVKGGRAVCK
jgi:hypothetical protein